MCCIILLHPTNHWKGLWCTMNIHEQDTNTSLLSTHQGTNPPLTNQPQEVKCHSSMHQSYQAVSNPRTSENSLPSKKKKQQNGRSQLSSSRNIPAKAVAPGFDSSKIAILCLDAFLTDEGDAFWEKSVLRPISGACFKQFSTWQKGCQRRAKSSRFLWLSYFPANLLPPPIGWP